MRVLLFEGVFYERSESTWVETDQGHESINEALQSFHGQTIKILMHHVHDPDHLDRWGLGSCLWQPSECPFGHHSNPHSLFHFENTGLLNFDKLSLSTSNGVKKLPLDYLWGHRSRLVAFSTPEDLQFDVSTTEARAENLKSTLTKLKSILENL